MPQADAVRPPNRTWIAAFWAAIGAAVLGIIYVSLRKGIWYDEIWPVFMGRHDLSFGRAYLERWIYDDYPPMYYAANWLLEPLTGDFVGYRRLINLLPLALVALALVPIARTRRDLALPIMLGALLSLTNPIGFDFAVLLRAYFGQCCAWFLCLCCLLAVVTSGRDYEKRDFPLAMLLASSIFVSLNLHYLLTLQSGLTLACFIGSEWLAGHRRWAARIFVMTAIGSLTLVFAALIQLPLLSYMAKTYWAQTTTTQALAITALALALILGSNLAALAAMVMDWRQRSSLLMKLRQSGALRFAITGGLSIVVCLIAMLLFNVFRPVIIRQYLAPVFPLGEMVLAAVIYPVVQRHRSLFALIIANALLLVTVYTWRRSNVKDWADNAAFIAGQVRSCPGTRVLAVPFWTMRGQSDAELLHNEPDVARFGFSQLGDQYGFTPEFRVSANRQTTASGPCSTIVWTEHYYPPGPSSADVARAAKLYVSPAIIRAARVHNSSSGFAVVFGGLPTR